MTGNLPQFGPSEVFGGVDELEPAVAVVRVAIALTRTQLVTALGISFAGIAAEQTPETLTDAQVRQEVEEYLASEALSELDRQMERDEARVFSPESQRVMQVLAAAVDRAYTERPAPAVQSPRYGAGTVTLQTLDQGEVTIPEPAWCEGHDGQLVGPLAEVSHDGRDFVATVDTASLGEVALLRANITHAPYLVRQPEPHPVAYVEALEAVSVDAGELRMVAARLAVTAGRLRDLAGELDRLKREGSS